MLSFMERLFLSQQVREATRGDNTLDLVLTNHMEMISHMEIRPTVRLSDHHIILTHLTVDPGARAPKVTKENLFSSKVPLYNLSKGNRDDWLRYQSLMEQADWPTVSVDLSLEERITLLTSLMEETIATMFPLKKGKLPGNRIPIAMRKLMDRRRRLGAKLIRTKNWEACLRLRGELEQVESRIQASNDSRMKEEEGAMADILSTQYSSVFSTPREEVTPAFLEATFQEKPQVTRPLLDSVTFSEEGVGAAIRSLSNSAAPGPDGIPMLCFKWGGHLVLKALVNIFQVSMDTHQVDQTMRRAFISPIWKPPGQLPAWGQDWVLNPEPAPVPV